MDVKATKPCRDLNSATSSEPLTAKKSAEVFGGWIRAQQEDFERNGLWSDGLVPWQGDGSCGGAS
jgi:hypothetical protein